jgi:hypothetical protein
MMSCDSPIRQYHASACSVYVPSLSSLSLTTMADKEATVYVVDVGRSMGDRRHGRSVSDLDYAIQYVWDRVTATVSSRARLYHLNTK